MKQPIDGLRAAAALAALSGLWLAGLGSADEPAVAYVGAEACGECHAEQYHSYEQNAAKAHSFQSVQLMRRGLTEDELRACYGCHTTGYGSPGGFVSETETPHLSNAGCEVCHGPGQAHLESMDASDIVGSPPIRTCERCHNAARVAEFGYKPMLYAGGH